MNISSLNNFLVTQNNTSKIQNNFQNNYSSSPNICFKGKGKIASDVFQLGSDKAIALKAWETISEAKSIIIQTHSSADGDALASGLAMKQIIEERFPTKEVVFYAPGLYPNSFDFLPDIEKITKKDPTHKFDLAIAVDVAKDRVNGSAVFKTAKNKIVIDHHSSSASNDCLSIIDPNLKSTTDIIYNKFLKQLGFVPSRETVLCLYTGLLTDTRAFKLANPQTLKTKTELEDLGRSLHLDPEQITKKIDEGKVISSELDELINDLRTQGLKNVFTTREGRKVNYALCSHKMLEDRGIKDTSTIININMRNIANHISYKSDIGILFSERRNENLTDVYIRSTKLNLLDFVSFITQKTTGLPGAVKLVKEGRIEDIQADILSLLRDFKFNKRLF